MNSQPASQSSRLYVGGLNLSVTQKDVDDLFNKFGKILEIRMNRNFAFVQFAEESEAQSAIKELNGTQHFGRRLDVQIARHPKSGGGGGGAGGGGGGPGPNKMDDIPSRDGRDRSPIGGRGGGPGRGGMGGGVGGRGGFGGRGGDRGGMYNSGGGGRGGFNDEPGFGGRSGGDFRGGPDYRGGGDFPPRQESSFGRSSDSGLFGGSGGGRDFSLAPPTGFRDSGRGSGWGSGGGVGVGLNDKAFEPRPRGGDLGPSISSYNQDRPPTHPVEPVSVPNNERTNDIEIIIVDKALTEYGEMIERRMSCLGFSVDVLFPHEAVPLARVLANIASRGTLYAAVITHVHQINGSLTLHILHGRPQEHRNMAIDDAITLLLRNYETYTRSCKEKGGPNCPPEQVRHLLQQVLNGRQLTTTQYDILVQYLLQEKLKSEPQLNQPGNNSQNSTAQQAELQTRILSILNKTSVGDAQQAPPVLPPHGRWLSAWSNPTGNWAYIT